MIVTPIKTRIFQPGEDLEKFILKHAPKPKEGSVLVVTSKIVALSQGRLVKGDSHQLKLKKMRELSEKVLKTKYTYLTLYQGELILGAGIDRSNVKDSLVFLPSNPFMVATKLRKSLMNKWGLKNLGIIISDSRTSRMRAGSKGVSIGYAGFKGLRRYRGKKDLFGRTLMVSRVNVADSLSASAVVCMGEASEAQPLALIQNAPVEWVSKVNPKELYIDPKDDVYRPYFDWLNKQKKRKK